MTLFIRRFIGALMLDAGAYEDIESDRHAGASAVLVIALACAAGAFAAKSLTVAGSPGFAIAMAIMLGWWIVWAMLITAIGTRLLPEPQTRSNPSELLRSIGFAAAPGTLYAFAAMPAVAPFVFALVSLWMIAATVIAVRQALDYTTTWRAIAVCVIAWLLSFGVSPRSARCLLARSVEARRFHRANLPMTERGLGVSRGVPSFRALPSRQTCPQSSQIVIFLT